MSKITSGKQWKVVLVGDIPPEWPENKLQVGQMIQSAINLNMLLLMSFKWSNIEFSERGSDFPLPGTPQSPLQ